MKPFITPRKTHAGKLAFEFQLEGLTQTGLESLLQKRLLAHEVMGEQSFCQSWEFRLHFDCNLSLEFSSACTQLHGWDEIGSLNICMWKPDDSNVSRLNLPSLSDNVKISRVEKLVFEDPEIISECGLLIASETGTEITIATGVSPGSVSVQWNISDDIFEPYFPISDCKSVPLPWHPE